MPPDLSIIIPTLNEEQNIVGLLTDLEQQQNIAFEIIVADGGSTDQTRDRCRQYPGLNIRIVSTSPGRARQMNLGAQSAQGRELLFLHADSRIADSHLLNQALDFIKNSRTRENGTQVAGHFPLRFIRQNTGYEKAYYFYESKTCLNRPDCINGDQGFWLHRSFFQALGGFDQSLPYMEDARLSQAIFQQGHWQTLPGYVSSSARRFESEGLRQRQILNSFLCIFNAIGLDSFFTTAQDAYRIQDRTRTLQLRPFLRLARQQMQENGLWPAVKRWYLTGGYIADNAWQLAFALDCRRNQKRGLPPGSGQRHYLGFFDRYLKGFISSPPCRMITAIISAVGFYGLFLLT